MEILEEEIRQDLLDDAKEIAFLKERLSGIAGKIDDGGFQLILDAICEYYAMNDTFNVPDGTNLEIDCGEVASCLINNLQDKLPDLQEEELTDVVMLDLEYNGL